MTRVSLKCKTIGVDCNISWRCWKLKKMVHKYTETKSIFRHNLSSLYSVQWNITKIQYYFRSNKGPIHGFGWGMKVGKNKNLNCSFTNPNTVNIKPHHIPSLYRSYLVILPILVQSYGPIDWQFFSIPQGWFPHQCKKCWEGNLPYCTAQQQVVLEQLCPKS